MSEYIFKSGHNTPPHLFVAGWFYMITGSTYKQQPFLLTNDRKVEWINAFMTAAELYHWEVVAWVILDNHYHVIVKSPAEGATNLPKFIASYHKFTARRWNEQDKTRGRMVWWNYWDTCIRSEQDYINRLHYVFWNPVKHGLVREPAEYPYSNYTDFLSQEWFKIGYKAVVEVENVPEF